MKAIERELQAVVDLAMGDAGPGAILGVTAPHLDVEWKGASGVFKRDGRKRLKATDGFRIASMSKTFTATLLMQLVEQGKLSLDARLGDFFPKEFVRRVHPRASAITLAHLLNHTAGLWDFAMSDAWGAELRGDPGKFRHPDAILEWAWRTANRPAMLVRDTSIPTPAT
jgi:D-alanyl-D-alanine carboxypeptidase